MKETLSPTPSNLQGRMIGASLTAAQIEDVRDFYKQIIGWNSVEISRGDSTDYRMTTPEGEFVAGIHHPAGSFSGLPRALVPTFFVSDLRASLEACRRLGGQVLMEPAAFDKNSGAVIEYPPGAYCGLCQM